MSPNFEDFASLLLSEKSSISGGITRKYKDGFLDYLHSCDIEYTNYGAFFEQSGGAGKVYFADTNFSPDWVEECFVEGYVHHDYPLLRAKALTEDQFASFELGEWLAPRLVDQAPMTAQILRGAGDAGMRDGFALVGRKRIGHGKGASELRWNFGIGGELGVRKHIEAQLPEITIAAAMLIDTLMPEISSGVARQFKALTARERDVLGCFAKGLQRDRAAEAIGASVHTVDFHCRNVRGKLGAATMAEAVAKGLTYGQI